MKINIFLKLSSILVFSFFLLNSCGKQVDATKYPPDPRERVKKNLEEGKGFRLSSKLKQMGKGSGGDFDFASSNSLWRATLDIIDFMPLATANYSGGIIVTDWYSDDINSGESLKFTIRFLTNEIRSDAINLKVFYKICKKENNCSVTENTGQLGNELKKEILKQAAIYEKTKKDKDFKPYKVVDPKKD
tara:strand:+ start:229 stop:795 length:567 start_codon:yes stop_codon:yes gene_type:complete